MQRESRQVIADRPRVAWVAQEPTPYHMAFFQHLRQHVPLEMHFFFCSLRATQPWLLGRYALLSLPNRTGRGSGGAAGRASPGASCGLWPASGGMRWSWRDMGVGRSWRECSAAGAADSVHPAFRYPFAAASLQAETSDETSFFSIRCYAAAARRWGWENSKWSTFAKWASRRLAFLPSPDCPPGAILRGSGPPGGPARPDAASTGNPRGGHAGRVCRPVGGRERRGRPARSLALLAPTRRPHLLLVGDGPQRATLERLVGQAGSPRHFRPFSAE